MEIVLIRHAKANKRKKDLEDIRRYVTKKGKERFKVSLPELKEKLEPISEREIMLWSSPALRTLETAHIIANCFQITIDSVEDFIYEGNFDDFSDALQMVSEEKTLLIVGHEPLLSEWIKNLVGDKITITTGSIINFKVVNRSPLEAELQWVIKAA